MTDKIARPRVVKDKHLLDQLKNEFRIDPSLTPQQLLLKKPHLFEQIGSTKEQILKSLSNLKSRLSKKSDNPEQLSGETETRQTDGPLTSPQETSDSGDDSVEAGHCEQSAPPVQLSHAPSTSTLPSKSSPSDQSHDVENSQRRFSEINSASPSNSAPTKEQFSIKPFQKPTGYHLYMKEIGKQAKSAGVGRDLYGAPVLEVLSSLNRWSSLPEEDKIEYNRRAAEVEPMNFEYGSDKWQEEVNRLLAILGDLQKALFELSVETSMTVWSPEIGVQTNKLGPVIQNAMKVLDRFDSIGSLCVFVHNQLACEAGGYEKSRGEARSQKRTLVGCHEMRQHVKDAILQLINSELESGGALPIDKYPSSALRKGLIKLNIESPHDFSSVTLDEWTKLRLEDLTELLSSLKKGNVSVSISDDYFGMVSKKRKGEQLSSSSAQKHLKFQALMNAPQMLKKVRVNTVLSALSEQAGIHEASSVSAQIEILNGRNIWAGRSGSDLERFYEHLLLNESIPRTVGCGCTDQNPLQPCSCGCGSIIRHCHLCVFCGRHTVGDHGATVGDEGFGAPIACFSCQPKYNDRLICFLEMAAAQ